MEYTLTECRASGQEYIWKITEELWTLRGQKFGFHAIRLEPRDHTHTQPITLTLSPSHSHPAGHTHTQTPQITLTDNHTAAHSQSEYS